MILCWPRRAPVAHVAHHVRRHRRARRAIVWTCITIFGGAAGAIIPPLFVPTLPSSPYIEPSARVAIPTPESAWAVSPGREARPIPEPGSIVLLATAVAAMAAWRMR